MRFEKLIGRQIEIVYIDRLGEITQRRIDVRDVQDGKIRAKCLEANAPRVFLIKNVLAIRPIRKTA